MAAYTAQYPTRGGTNINPVRLRGTCWVNSTLQAQQSQSNTWNHRSDLLKHGRIRQDPRHHSLNLSYLSVSLLSSHVNSWFVFRTHWPMSIPGSVHLRLPLPASPSIESLHTSLLIRRDLINIYTKFPNLSWYYRTVFFPGVTQHHLKLIFLLFIFPARMNILKADSLFVVLLTLFLVSST